MAAQHTATAPESTVGTGTRDGVLALAGVLLPLGVVVYTLSTMAHPAREDPNSYAPVFAEYAESGSWTAVHFAQYASALLLIGGLAALAMAVVREKASSPVLAWFGLVAASATVASFSVLFAVDGVSLKRAVDAWAAAAGSGAAGPAFAAARAIRWVEIGVNGFSFLLLGLTLMLVSAALAGSRLLPHWTAWLGLVVGLAFAAHGVMVAYVGFAPTFPAMVGLPGLFAWTLATALLIWLRGRRHEVSAAH